jgi:hypothetical protein
MNFRVATYLGAWDIGGGLAVERNRDGFRIKPLGRFSLGLLVIYFLIAIGVPGIGLLTSPGLYASYDALRAGGSVRSVLSVVLEYPRFSVVTAGYCLTLLLYPVWALFFRAKPMVVFDMATYTVIFGRFWHNVLRFARKRIPFEQIREIEILHTTQAYGGGTVEQLGRPLAVKNSYFLSVITEANEPFYIIRLPEGSRMSEAMAEVAEVCGLPLVHETFPP